MTLTPPTNAEPVLLVLIDLEDESAVIKRGVSGEPFAVNLWEVWPWTKESTGISTWLFRIDPTISSQDAGTDPLSACIHTKKMAELDDGYSLKCIQGEKVFYIPDSEARIEGHIYSEEGRSEFAISGACEFHFDKWFSDEKAGQAPEYIDEDTQPVIEEEE